MTIITIFNSSSPSLFTRNTPPFTSKLPPSTAPTANNTPISFPISTLPHRQINISSHVALKPETTIIRTEEEESMAKIGSRVRVKVPLKVYHVPKVPEVDLSGMIGQLKENVTFWKGKRISANFPYKVEFLLPNVQGRNGPLKFTAHLKEDEFEYLD